MKLLLLYGSGRSFLNKKHQTKRIYIFLVGEFQHRQRGYGHLFTSQHDEISDYKLSVKGTLPVWLKGTLVESMINNIYNESKVFNILFEKSKYNLKLQKHLSTVQ